MKRLLVPLLALCLLTAPTQTAQADPVTIDPACLSGAARAPIGHYYTNVQVQIAATNECYDFPYAGVLQNGSTLVLARQVFEAAGFNVQWQPFHPENPIDSYTVWIKGYTYHHGFREQNLIRLKLYDETMRVNGENVALPVRPQLIDNRTRGRRRSRLGRGKLDRRDPLPFPLLPVRPGPRG